MLIGRECIKYEKVQAPVIHRDCVPVTLTDETMKERLDKVLSRMEQKGYEVLLIYADREHGANFAYLTGFAPRFEEAVLALHADGTAYLLLGNEMLHMAQRSRVRAHAVHVPYFSLPNQPMENDRPFQSLLSEAGLRPGMRTAVAGWKLFTSGYAKEASFLDVPSFLADAIRELAGAQHVVNGTGLLIDPAFGARTVMNANEIAFYEYGACLASVGMAELLGKVQPGMTELEAACYLERNGEPNSVQTILASGERFTNAVVSPRNKKLERGTALSATIGYRGGLTNRVAYLVSSAGELPGQEKDYLERVAVPYYQAAASWYTSVKPGVRGSEIYALIERVIPKEQYGWSLNPGHFVADEEWLSSPFTKDSTVTLQSGMALQMDIIVKVAGYKGCNAEDGVVIMDDSLQEEMARQYPRTWRRFLERRRYMRETLGLWVDDTVFPMSDIGGYVRPYLLNREYAFCIRGGEK